MIAVILSSSNIKNNQKQRIIMENNIKKDSVETPNEDKSANASQKAIMVTINPRKVKKQDAYIRF